MCGITAIISKNHNNSDSINQNTIQILYEALFNLQHRGQESSGLITFSNKTKKTYKSKKFGLVDAHLLELPELKGNMGIAHVRYPTSGQTSKKEIQPFFISKPYGITLVHNGNLSNKNSLNQFLTENNIYTNSSSDSEIILNLFYFFIEKDFNKLTNEIIVQVIRKIYDICNGSFSVIIMINDYGIIAFRDKYGIRPLVYSENIESLKSLESLESIESLESLESLKSSNLPYILFASETIALNTPDYKNIKNGEIVIVNQNLDINKYNALNESTINDLEETLKPCLFEYIYFARAESYINDILVYNFREKMGEKIAEFIDKSILEEIDIIVPVPQTSLISATGLANKINKPIKHAIIKNRYTHRTFINKGDEIIKNIKKIKVIKELVQDKSILIIDDSIVRGNTSKYIVEELRKANIKKLYFVSCCPPIRNPNIYGIAIPTHTELIAHDKSIKEIRDILNVDELYYLPLCSMIAVLNDLNPKIRCYEDSVFTGKYL